MIKWSDILRWLQSVSTNVFLLVSLSSMVMDLYRASSDFLMVSSFHDGCESGCFSDYQ
jgi:hypothetical protein